MRSLVVPVVAVVAVAGYLVAAGALSASIPSDSSASSGPRVANPWRAGYSRQFPGCVASVLWPDHESPAAIIVRWRSGDVDRIAMREEARRMLADTRSGAMEVIGACYRR